MTDSGGAGGIKQRVAGRWQSLQDRYRWLRHVLSAWQLLQRNHGNEYAAAITYFSFLALFPLLLLAVSVTGFVLHSHPHLQRQLFDQLSQNVPGEFGTTLKTSLHDAIDARTGVGIIGLVGVLLTGLGWIGNLREAIDAVWGRAGAKRNFLMARVVNLVRARRSRAGHRHLARAHRRRHLAHRSDPVRPRCGLAARLHASCSRSSASPSRWRATW